MPVDNTTANRGYQLPYATNQLDYDVARIIAALNGIDVDVASLFASLAGKAAAVHGHAITDVSGLQAALDGKIGTGTLLPIAQVSGLQASLDAKAPINNATFTGTTAGVTPAAGANNTQFATTQWVVAKGYLTTVITANIADGAVTEPKLGSSAVTETKIANLAVTFAKMAAAAVASAAEFMSNTASKLLTAAGVWDAAVPVTIPFAATVNLDFATFINGKILATSNFSLGTPTRTKKGQMGILEITHSGAGRTMTLSPAYFKAAAGFSLSTTAGAVDYVSYYVCDDGKVLLNVVKNPA